MSAENTHTQIQAQTHTHVDILKVSALIVIQTLQECVCLLQ